MQLQREYDGKTKSKVLINHEQENQGQVNNVKSMEEIMKTN